MNTTFLTKIQLTKINIKKATIYGLTISIIIYLISTLIGILLITTHIVTTDTDISNATQITQNQPNYLILSITLIIVSILEEIIFRGILLTTIKQHLKPGLTIITTSIIFALSHIGYMQIYTIVFAFFMGLILACLVFKTKNLMSSITAHTFYNILVLTTIIIL